MLKTIITSIISAIVGGLVVFSAINVIAPFDYQRDDGVPPIVRDDRQGASGASLGLSASEVYENFGPGVVHIRSVFKSVRTDFFGFVVPGEREAEGSGFIIDKTGLIVTNAHVVQDSFNKASRIIVVMDDKTEVEAKIIGTDPSTDLALLKIDPGKKRLKVLELGDSSELKVGDAVYAIGSPFGLEGTMTQGIVSALNRMIDSPSQQFKIRNVIQTDAAVNPGNSGGPLINSDGKVIGVNSQIAARSGDFAGIAFAVPSNTVKKVTAQIKDKGKASHPWVGIAGIQITKELADFADLPVSQGVMIAEVVPNSPAEKAGLRGGDQRAINRETGAELVVGGDIITKIGNTKVLTMDDVISYIDKHKTGDKIELEIYQGKQKKVVTVVLGERPLGLGE